MLQQNQTGIRFNEKVVAPDVVERRVVVHDSHSNQSISTHETDLCIITTYYIL